MLAVVGGVPWTVLTLAESAARLWVVLTGAGLMAAQAVLALAALGTTRRGARMPRRPT
ncbi:hypothetical protein [Actinomadura kijaniata]|uniref:hypothetical protein n=1 Tax=Actinomadura kijaniata TaxID=46161 RepID=UPI0012F7CA1B|nr:hypothetical protein [Actinomadura kijaniata]